MSVEPPIEHLLEPGDDPPQRECWRCGKSVDAELPICPYCAAILAKNSASPAASMTVSQADNALMRMLVAYGIILVLSVLFALIFSVALAGPPAPSQQDVLVATFFLEGIDTVIVIAALASIRLRGPVFRRSISEKALAWILFLPGLAGMLALNAAYHTLLRSIAHINLVESDTFKDPSLLAGWIFVICVQPAIIEELFFRYLALGTLRTVTGVHAAVVLSSVMFGMLHLGVPLSIPMLIVLGIGLGYARVFSGGLALPMVLHFLHNAAVLMLEKTGGASMNEKDVVSSDAFPVASVLWGLFGILMIAIGVTLHNPHWSIAAVPLIALAWGFYFFRLPSIVGRLEESALVLTVPEVTIPYDTIESLTLARRHQDPDGTLVRGPIVLVHSAGVVTIPAKLNMPVEELYRELAARTQTSGWRDVHGDLREHAAKQIETFGDDRVWTFSARTGRIGRQGNRRQFGCSVLLGLAAIFWFLAPFICFNPAKSPESMAWMGFGAMLGLFSLIGVLTATETSRYIVKAVPRWRESSLLISPSGIAMIQGNMRGHMRWDELRNIRLGSGQAGHVSFTSNYSTLFPAIRLEVAGASILIFDIYDRPLPTIAKVIRQLWQAPAV